MREDEPHQSLSNEEALFNAPEKEGGYFKVPKIIIGGTVVEYTIHGLHEKLVNKDISSVELTKKIIAHRNLVEGRSMHFCRRAMKWRWRGRQK